MTSMHGRLPVLPLRNAVLFPGLTQVVKVGRERSVSALKEAEKRGFWIITTQQIPQDDAIPAEKPIGADGVHTVGTLCRIDSLKGKPENGYQVVLRGFARVRLEDLKLLESENFLEAFGQQLDDVNDMNEQTEKALLDSLRQLGKDILKVLPGNTDQLNEMLNGIDDLSYLTALCAGNIDVDLKEKQKILEMTNLRERALHLLNLMKSFKESLELQAEIRNKLSQKLGQQQRQSILREHMKAIREELDGSSEDGTFEEKMQKKFDEAGLPDEVRKVAESELRRLTEIGPQSPESHVIRNYLELIAALPWSKSAVETDIDLEAARRILDADHYGMEQVKKRIVQQLAVMKLRKNAKGSILLFLGPPGIGKTSLASSIAKALGRKFIRVSVGGVRDDAEIRGHRRTYVGALPGRVIAGLKRVQENNPVFLLDEIDKMGRGYQGDPAAALLEVLDPEQNANFTDHYLEVPFDLSKVMFIATANQLDGIPAPLLDRMEIIDMTGYTLAEKFHIAKNHLIPKQMEEQGFKPGTAILEDDALTRLISSYTREAGVRELDRKVAAVLRGVSEKVVAKIEKNETDPVRIKSFDIEEILGPDRYLTEEALEANPPGVVTGLAWTPVGGDILFVETTAMPGRGDLILTGKLGDVMRESAQIAQSLIRSHLKDLGLNLEWRKYDLHLHVPAGATPKDGPSAGVSILSSMISLLTGRPVSSKLAMTGEITLRGAITPVGGIKEKVIAAHRAGIRTVVLPERNRRDLREIPQDVVSEMEIHFVARVEELLKLVFDLDLKPIETQFLLDLPLTVKAEYADLESVEPKGPPRTDMPRPTTEEAFPESNDGVQAEQE
ncbi:MAG: endopeptidase La [Bdellovibrionaceae bacterium]|nr:endopeptidase La [Pseudobdellovibrionaceae bacterium]